MAPIKFEENIKEKLEERTLQPSSQAWSTLSEKLVEDTNKSSNKTFWWLGIAASFIGIFLVVNTFLKTSETSSLTPVLVETEAQEVEVFESENDIVTPEISIAIEGSNVTEIMASEKNINPKKIKNEAVIVNKNQVKNNSLAQLENTEESEEVLNNSISETPSFEIKVVNLETQDKINKTETNIDSLLSKAQQHIAEKSQVKTYSIDANALLQDVEEDLDESFRAKVFETVKTNYKRVKTAVAHRND